MASLFAEKIYDHDGSGGDNDDWSITITLVSLSCVFTLLEFGALGRCWMRDAYQIILFIHLLPFFSYFISRMKKCTWCITNVTGIYRQWNVRGTAEVISISSIPSDLSYLKKYISSQSQIHILTWSSSSSSSTSSRKKGI